MRVLVTGGSGFIGRHVVSSLIARGDEVVVLDLKAHHDASVSCVVGDICDRDAVGAAFDGPIDAVVHLAAMTSVLQSVNEPDEVFRVNVLGTEVLLEACRERAINRFVFSSTNAVVGDVGTKTINETIQLSPMTPYGATKASAEMLFSAYSASYGITTISVRFTNVYGAGMQTKDSVVARLMRAGLSGDSIKVYGDGEQVRDYLYVSDAARALIFGLGVEHSDVLTVGAGESVSMNTLHRLACEVTGVDIPKEYVRAKPGEMPAVIVDTSHARHLGFSPEYDVRSGLAATWDDFRHEHR